MRTLLAVAVLCITGCSRYADFTLPPPDPSGPRGPFHWSAMPNPVIDRGDAVDVLNPSVVRSGGESVNFYSRYDGKAWSTMRATSTDFVTWQNRAPVDLPSEGGMAANGSLLAMGTDLMYWYEAGAPPHIALKGQAVLTAGPLGGFDEIAVADPDVIRASGAPGGARFFLYYLGQDRAQRQRLGVAQSTDGIHWTKFRDNPILEPGPPGSFDERGVGEPAVWTSGGSYWMLYTGRARDETRRIGLAKSADGVHWQRDTSFPPIAGDQPWNRAVMCDPSVEVLAGKIRVWFGGGDVPRPDQNIHGQIGMGFLFSLR
ncbi:MAG TPA: hypothetical protein VKS01_05685 [Bryobacteraceae bacterium]|nr:hypothetical protein [Bryobacteraceae bacterium]